MPRLPLVFWIGAKYPTKRQERELPFLLAKLANAKVCRVDEPVVSTGAHLFPAIISFKKGTCFAQTVFALSEILCQPLAIITFVCFSPFVPRPL